MASDRALRNANATPIPARAINSTTTLGATAPSTPNTAAPDAPTRNIRLIPYRSPSTPAPNTEAARVRVASDDTVMAMLGEICRPVRMREMLADRILRSPTATALPKPMASVAMTAATPLTCSC